MNFRLRTPDSGLRTYFYLYNAHGDVAGLTDSNGATVATYTYDEFGNLKSSTGSIYNPLRYSGANNAYYDEETGLYKMGARYYQPEVGRWLTRDEYEGVEKEPLTKNRYLYTESNPVSNLDSTGHWAAQISYQKGDVTPYLRDVLRVDAQWAYLHRNLSWINKFRWFRDIVDHAKSWDLKRQSRWPTSYFMHFRIRCVSPEAFGNIHYGYVGRALGYSLLSLRIGSVAAHIGSSQRWATTNEYKDQGYITWGHNLYPIYGRTPKAYRGLNLYAQFKSR